MGKRLVNTKKIGKIVNKWKRENKKQQAPSKIENCEDKNQ